MCLLPAETAICQLSYHAACMLAVMGTEKMQDSGVNFSKAVWRSWQ